MSRPPLAFRVSGLDCAEEVTLLKRAVGPLAGGEVDSASTCSPGG